MEHHAYESEQHTNAKVCDSVARELILLVDSCAEYLIARMRYNMALTEEARRESERARTRYGHKLMTILGDDATDEAIDTLSAIAEEVARNEVNGTGLADEEYLDSAMSVLRGSTE
jgi:undecaprenyl pyrophosphate synthase